MGLRTVKGGNQALRRITKEIQALPRTLALEVASRGGPALTDLTQQAYSSGRTVYGEARPVGVDGNALTLNDSGNTAAELRFDSTGTRIKAVLPRKYQRYLIGKYSVLPNGALPAAFRAKLDALVKQVRPA